MPILKKNLNKKILIPKKLIEKPKSKEEFVRRVVVDSLTQRLGRTPTMQEIEAEYKKMRKIRVFPHR